MGMSPRTLVRIAFASAGFALAASCPALASDSGREDGRATSGGMIRAAARSARTSATSSRPLCRSGWHLSGSRRHGYACARAGRRRRPSCQAHYQLRPHGRGYICLRRVSAGAAPTAPSATTAPHAPAPAPTPPGQAPSPAATATMEQNLLGGAFENAKRWGEKEISEASYTHVYSWRIEPNGCALIAQYTAECVLLLYKEVEVLNYDPSSIANDWYKAIYLLGVYYEYQGPELGYRLRLGQIGDWAVGPWKWL
jgi:hypothetical protein